VTPLPLRVRLALVFSAGFAVLLGLGALAFYFYLARSYHRDFDRSLLDAGRSTRALFRQDRAEFATAADAATHIITELLYGDRTLVAFDSADHFLAASQRVAGEPWFNDVSTNGIHNAPVTVTLRDGPARLLRVPLEGGTEVVIAMSTLPLERRLVRLRAALVTILPIILVLGAVIGAWGTRVVLRPIVEVAESAERVGAEVGRGANHFTRLPPRAVEDELTTLTDSFNLLVDRLEAALEQERGVAERQRRFLANAAHELRTPVAILRSEAEVSLRGEQNAAHYRQALEGIAAEAARLGSLLADLLLLARGDAQALTPERQRVFLDDLMNRAVARARALPEAAGREIQRGEFEAAPVYGDPALLERLLMVLIHNALIHAPGSAIEVSTGVSGNGERAWSWATVRDHGPGIPVQDRERVFERFTRLDPQRPGSGLGLPIARSIAEVHGGTLVPDEVPDGTSFTLRLPHG
jgi:signal transduction histidine kinase